MSEIYKGDALEVLQTMEDEMVQTIITSPPYYGLRDYGIDGQLGLEDAPEEYIEKLVSIFREARRVLKKNGTLWLNLGDSYWHNRSNNGVGGGHGKGQSKNSFRCGGKSHSYLKPKDLIGIPWRVALALQQDGWYLRSDIIWHKPNTMPESVMDRPTKSHEHIFLFSKSQRYYYNCDAIKEPCVQGDTKTRNRDGNKLNSTPGRTQMGGLTKNNYEKKNKRDVWSIPTSPFKDAHFAVFPVELIEPCILAGSSKGDIVLDLFLGSGTTAIASMKNDREFIGIEIKQEYIEIAKTRVANFEEQICF